MLILNENIEMAYLLSAAELLCVAAQTAPKGKREDLLETALVSGEEKSQPQRQMRTIGKRDCVRFSCAMPKILHKPR